MLNIIPSVSKELLEAELSPDKFLKKTNYGNNEVYWFQAKTSPNLMREVGRLREISFRHAGGGTMQEADVDSFDISENPYTQIIVWDPKYKEILGGYRYIHCGGLSEKPSAIKESLATAEMFTFSDQFIQEYLPYTIELGRSFVQPAYQAAQSSRKTLFALDNLWDGLGALIYQYPEVRYFFGKVTMYTNFDVYARDIILYFLNHFFPDQNQLVRPMQALPSKTDDKVLSELFSGSNYAENYKILSVAVRKKGYTIPPLINSYMNLSPTMRSFGTGINYHFGEVEETGILVTIADIYESKKRRHITGKHGKHDSEEELSNG